MTQSTPLAAVLPAAARWGWGRYLHSLSRCQGDVAGIDTIRTRRLLPTDSGRSGFVPWSGRDGLPNRRAGIFTSVQTKRGFMSDIIHKPKPNFLQFLGTFERGELVDRLTREVEEIVAAMEQVDQDHGIQTSKGELVIKIKFARKKERYEITADSKMTAPKAPPAVEIMWATPGNSLVQENPRQQKFAFTEVVRPRGEAS